MGSYSETLTAEEHKSWSKRVRIWLLQNDMDLKDLADQIGYAYKTVIDSLGNYERCSRFFVAAVNDRMMRDEKSD